MTKQSSTKQIAQTPATDLDRDRMIKVKYIVENQYYRFGPIIPIEVEITNKNGERVMKTERREPTKKEKYELLRDMSATNLIKIWNKHCQLRRRAMYEEKLKKQNDRFVSMRVNAIKKQMGLIQHLM